MKKLKITTNEFEHQYWPNKIIGIDEAGRGPLAGPLVVAGVILPSYYEDIEIYDSKGLSGKKREMLFERIKEVALEYEIMVVEPSVIDELNILNATKMAMKNIGETLSSNIVLIDAVNIDIDNKNVIPIIKGDQKSISIAAASILAKVYRDRIMDEYDKIYPNYDFKSNKGYPTKRHLEAIEKYGILDIHRKSYKPVSQNIQLKLDI